jgi:Flp pilus assembly protein TadD
MGPDELLAKLDTLRASMRAGLTEAAVHEFARTVDALGYVDSRALDRRNVDFEKLAQHVYYYYRQFLKRHPEDAAAINNIGVTLSNQGKPRRARKYFARAVKVRRDDRNIHENLRIADILLHRPEHWWHDYAAELQPGPDTLVAYFDPHAM